MEEELRHIERQISIHEAGTLLESVPALGSKISGAIECTTRIKTQIIPNHSQTPLHFNIQFD